MSRKGKMSIVLESSVNIKDENGKIIVKGPKGELEMLANQDYKVNISESEVNITKIKNKSSDAYYGMYRSMIANMIEGVSKGYKKELSLIGVGFRVQKKGSGLNFSLGYSHPVYLEPIDGISFNIEGQTSIMVMGLDKQKVNQQTALIIKLKNAKKDPYKGKGIRIKGKILRKKAGKKVK